MIDTKSFEDAVRCGDVAVAGAFLAQPKNSEAVEKVEAAISAVGHEAFVPSNVRFRLQQQLQHVPRAWFYCGDRDSENIFFNTRTRLQNDLVAWLYGGPDDEAPGIPAIPRTLAFLFYGLLLAAIDDNNAVAMELLLMSSTFCDVFSDGERRIVLEDAMSRIGGRGAETTIAVLVSHGADINADDALPIYGSREPATVSLLQYLAAEGACFVGRQRVLHRMFVDTETVHELLHLGIDVRDDAVVDLRGAASSGSMARLEICEVLLAQGFVDVDAYAMAGGSAQRGTPLMRTVRGLLPERVDGVDDTLAFAALLLRFGADPHVPDQRGYSAVDYVTMATNDTLFKALSELLGAHHTRGVRS